MVPQPLLLAAFCSILVLVWSQPTINKDGIDNDTGHLRVILDEMNNDLTELREVS